MVSLTELGERTVGYLRKHVFNGQGNPEYVERNGLLVPTSIVDFEATQQSLETVDRSWVRDRVLGWARDSEEYVVIDIAAGFGSGYARQFAERFPHAQLFMVDDLCGDRINKEAPKLRRRLESDLVFSTYPDIDDQERCMNTMLQQAGYQNIKYIKRTMFAIVTGTQLPELDNITKGRHVLVTGICTPGGTSLAAAREAVYHGAEECYIVPAGLEYLTYSGESRFFETSSNLLSTEELENLFNISVCESTQQADEHMQIAVKQAIVVEIAHKLLPYFEPRIYRYRREKDKYNEPDHLIAGEQVAVMDRSVARHTFPKPKQITSQTIGGVTLYFLNGVQIGRLE